MVTDYTSSSCSCPYKCLWLSMSEYTDQSTVWVSLTSVCESSCHSETLVVSLISRGSHVVERLSAAGICIYSQAPSPLSATLVLSRLQNPTMRLLVPSPEGGSGSTSVREPAAPRTVVFGGAWQAEQRVYLEELCLSTLVSAGRLRASVLAVGLRPLCSALALPTVNQ